MANKFFLSSLIILSFLAVSCEDKNNGESEDFVSRNSLFKVYCIENFMADVGGWTITFSSDEIKTERDIFSLPKVQNPYEISLETEQDFNLGLPYGRYQGVREEDSQKIIIVISALDQVNTQSMGINWYNGSTIVGNQTFDISCWDSRE